MRTMKGQQSLGITIVGIAITLIIGIYIFSAISPALTNSAVTNDTIGDVGGASKTVSVTFPPIAPGTTPVLRNCSDATYGSCAALLPSGNWTWNPSAGTITSITDVRFVGIDYTSGFITVAANNAASTVDTNSYTAFTLGAIVVIVVAAAAILRNLNMF